MKGLELSVSQLNEYVRKSLAGDPMLRSICLKGELSNFKRHVSGHWYFTLKDADAAINCAMFRTAASSVRFSPRDGQRVRLFGSVGLYSKTGSYQFYADMMEQDGMGEWYLRFEALKQKLSAEGLFDPAIKKPLPYLPRGVGIITSGTGAVVHDIADVSRRRNDSVPLYLCAVKVQGEGAADEIADAIRLMDDFAPVDVLIVGRGGGSIEDLWCFNEERVARAIARCKKPVVSAVGHETDFTIADFVADLRAPTPSAAAELVVPEKEALHEAVSSMRVQLEQALRAAVSESQLALSLLQKRLISRSPVRYVEGFQARLNETLSRMEHLAGERLNQCTHALGNARLRLRMSSPMETVKRGYAIVTLGGKPLRSATDVATGDTVRVMLAQGALDASVTTRYEEDNAWLP